MDINLMLGDCLERMKELADNSVDSIVTDPPYGLSFMGKHWDKGVPSAEIWAEALRVLKPGGHLLAFAGTRTQHRMAVNIEDAGFEIRDMIAWVYGVGLPKSHNLKDEWAGWGTSLKPALEPVTVARKPFKGTVAANVQEHGTGALNIDGCRVGWPDGKVPEIGTPGWGGPAKKLTTVPGQEGKTVERSQPSSLGRWPANLIHDGSDEVVGLFPVTAKNSAARFFYCAKASKKDRGEDNKHPTVKPADLMRYLCRLVTPPNGIVLDPFMGSGSTGKAAMLEGFRFIGIELDRGYFDIAKQRINEAHK